MTFIKLYPDIKTSETDTHVFFLNGPFSQWWPSLFVAALEVAGETVTSEFHCCEQYMMARKAALFNDLDTLAEIMAVKQNPEKWQEAPRTCKELGRAVGGFVQDVWDAACDQIVLDGNLAKFQQNANMRDFMMSFGDKFLVEGAWYDKIWGVGLAWDDPKIANPENWQGQNKLGKVHMMVRDILRTTAPA